MNLLAVIDAKSTVSDALFVKYWAVLNVSTKNMRRYRFVVYSSGLSQHFVHKQKPEQSGTKFHLLTSIIVSFFLDELLLREPKLADMNY